MPTPDPPRPTVDSGKTSALVRLQEVYKFYPMGGSRVEALHGLTLTIDPGGFWAVMGPSGSGKSTLLNLLGCLDRPDRGTYLLDGRDVGLLDDNRLSDLRLQKIGFIFQNFNLIAQLTVLENIELPLFYKGWPAEDSIRRAVELAERVGLEDRIHHRPAELSGGQQQRVAIARSLANDPDLLLADEPTGNLDSATGKTIMGLLTELNRQGKTVVLVTHDPSVAAHANRRLYMQDGRGVRIEG